MRRAQFIAAFTSDERTKSELERKHVQTEGNVHIAQTGVRQVNSRVNNTTGIRVFCCVCRQSVGLRSRSM